MARLGDWDEDYLSKVVAIYKPMDTEQHFMAPRQTQVACQEQGWHGNSEALRVAAPWRQCRSCGRAALASKCLLMALIE